MNVHPSTVQRYLLHRLLPGSFSLQPQNCVVLSAKNRINLHFFRTIVKVTGNREIYDKIRRVGRSG